MDCSLQEQLVPFLKNEASAGSCLELAGIDDGFFAPGSSRDTCHVAKSAAGGVGQVRHCVLLVPRRVTAP